MSLQTSGVAYTAQPSPALLFTALLSPQPWALVSGGLSMPNPCYVMESQKCPLQCSSLMPVCLRMMFNT